MSLTSFPVSHIVTFNNDDNNNNNTVENHTFEHAFDFEGGFHVNNYPNDCMSLSITLDVSGFFIWHFTVQSGQHVKSGHHNVIIEYSLNTSVICCLNSGMAYKYFVLKSDMDHTVILYSCK